MLRERNIRCANEPLSKQKSLASCERSKNPKICSEVLRSSLFWRSHFCTIIDVSCVQFFPVARAHHALAARFAKSKSKWATRQIFRSPSDRPKDQVFRKKYFAQRGNFFRHMMFHKSYDEFLLYTGLPVPGRPHDKHPLASVDSDPRTHIEFQRL